MASLTDDEILDAVGRQMRRDKQYRQELETAIQRKDESWIARLVKSAVKLLFGIVVEVGRALLSALFGGIFGR